MAKRLLLSMCLALTVLSAPVTAQAVTTTKEFKVQQETPVIIKNFGEHIDFKIPIDLDFKESTTWKPYISFNAPINEMKGYLTSQLMQDITLFKIDSIYLSNNSVHNYYLTQRNTGQYSNSNCMAASAASIAKWINPGSSLTVEDVRREVRPQGGSIYTDEIEDFFDGLNIKYETPYIPDGKLMDAYELLLKSLNKGSIIMAVSDMDEISYDYSNNQSKLGKSYTDSFKHSYLITGYVLQNNKLYFEVFDPYDVTVETRYMDAKEVVNSITDHWGYVFEIPQQSTT